MTVSELRTLVDNLEEYIHVPDGIDRLKKMVLHLAVSGQLVQQDHSEGTGQELYKQIQAEKAELIKQGKIKKQKPLLEISEDEVPFGIPMTWKWARLGDLNPDYQNGLASRGEKSGKAVTVLRLADIKKRQISLVDTRELIVSGKNIEKYQVSSGDILITRVNGSADIVGQFTLCDKRVDAIYCDHFIRMRISKDLVVPEFLYILGDSSLLRRKIKNLFITTAGQKTINQGHINSLLIPLVPPLEQKRIVTKVNHIFVLIDQLAEAYKSEQVVRSKLVASSLAQLAKAENGVEDNLALTHLSEIIRTKADAKILRQTILHLAVSGQLVPQDSSEGTGEELYLQIQVEKQELIKRGKLKKQKPLPAIDEDEVPFTTPNGWKWARLGDLSDIFNGNSINASEKKLRYEKVTDGYPYIATKDIGYGFENVDYENGVKIPFSENNFKIISEGTALICSEGGSAGKKCGIVDRDVAFGNKMYAFKAFGGLILPEFVLYNYLSKQFYEQFSGKMTGIIGGISTANFKQLLMPLPPLAEQKRIVAKTTQLLNLITELEEHLVD